MKQETEKMNPGVVIPEFEIQNAIYIALTVFKDEANFPEEQKVLFNMWKNNPEYYSKCREIFETKFGDYNDLEGRVQIGYNFNKESMPVIHIMNNGYEMVGPSIGQNVGYTNQYPIGEDSNGFTEKEAFSEMYNGSSTITVFADNYEEEMLILYTLVFAFKGLTWQLDYQGIRNLKVDNTGIGLFDVAFPERIFKGQLLLSYFVEQESPSFYNVRNPFTIKFLGIPIDKRGGKCAPIDYENQGIELR